MGLLDRLFPSRRQFETLAHPASLTMALDWGEDLDRQFEKLAEFEPLTREEALEIPGVARGHHTIVSKIAQLELVADNGTGVANTVQPAFLRRADLGESPEMRMWCTADDLYFYGRALWAVERGSTGWPISGRWVPFWRWRVDVESGVLFIDEVPVDPSGWLLFEIPMWDGILERGKRTLRGARDIERAWTARMRSPVALVELSVKNTDELSQERVDSYVRAWQRKHRSGAPAVGMTPPGMDLITHQNAIGPADLFTEARDTVRTDIASHSSLDGSQVDSTGGTSSLTYETHEGQRADFYEFDLPFWTIPFTARLSMGDVVPRGTRVLVRFRPVVAPNQTEVDDQKVTYANPGAPAQPSEDDDSDTVPSAHLRLLGGTNG